MVWLLSFFLSQLGMFKSQGEWLSGSALYTMIRLVVLTMGIMIGLPYLTKKSTCSTNGHSGGFCIGYFRKFRNRNRSFFVLANGGDGIQAGFPSFNVPLVGLSLANFYFILPYACILAAIGLIESLMTLNLIDELTDSHGSGNRECAAQGLGNIVNGFFGGMGGCAMIGQSIINIKSGGRGRLSGITAAIALLCFILFGSSYIEQVPIAALVGVMFMVVFGTFAWSSFQVWNKVPKSDVLVIILVTGLTVVLIWRLLCSSGVVVSSFWFLLGKTPNGFVRANAQTNTA